jgi:hypothetical protein
MSEDGIVDDPLKSERSKRPDHTIAAAAFFGLKFTPSIYLIVFVTSVLLYELAFLLALASLLLALVLTVIYFFKRRYWTSLASILSPVMALLLGFSLTQVGVTSNSVGFAIAKPRYISELNATAFGHGELHFKAWLWRDESPLFGQILKYVVYDESDQITLPISQRSVAWVAAAKDTFIWGDFEILVKGFNEDHNGWDGKGTYEVDRIGEHFYFVTTYAGFD